MNLKCQVTAKLYPQRVLVQSIHFFPRLRMQKKANKPNNQKINYERPPAGTTRMSSISLLSKCAHVTLTSRGICHSIVAHLRLHSCKYHRRSKVRSNSTVGDGTLSEYES
jgi:hypothetical protein